MFKVFFKERKLHLFLILIMSIMINTYMLNGVAYNTLLETISLLSVSGGPQWTLTRYTLAVTRPCQIL